MLLLDGQVHHDTHVVPMGNYVIGVGNYVIVSPSDLGNYVIADTPDLLHAISRQHVHRSTSVQVTVPGSTRPSRQVRTGCCTFPLYSSARPVKLAMSV